MEAYLIQINPRMLHYEELTCRQIGPFNKSLTVLCYALGIQKSCREQISLFGWTSSLNFASPRMARVVEPCGNLEIYGHSF